MATDIKLWRVVDNDKLEQIDAGSFSEMTKERQERDLQKWVLKYPALVSDDLIVIGKEIENIDILGIDRRDGKVVVVELKKDEPRDAIGQAIDYASLVSERDEDWLKSHAETKGFNLSVFDDFEEIDMEEPRIYVVGTKLQDVTERMIRYLWTFEVDINLVILRYHKEKDSGNEFLTRTHFLTEETAQELSGKKKKKVYKTIEAYLSHITKFNIPETMQKIENLVDLIQDEKNLWIRLGKGEEPGLMIDCSKIKDIIYVYPRGRLSVWRWPQILDVFGESKVTGFKQQLIQLGFNETKSSSYEIELLNFKVNDLQKLIETTVQFVEE